MAISIEIITDSLFSYFLSRPAWSYKILPVHNGYTTMTSPVLWSMYGFHLYLFHKVIKERSWKGLDDKKTKAILIGVDAMALEILANAFSILLFKSYYFYYYQLDMNNFTTIEIFVPYVIGGYLGLSLLYYFNKYQYKKTIGGIYYAIGLVIIFSPLLSI